jgi:hypothetical protein
MFTRSYSIHLNNMYRALLIIVRVLLAYVGVVYEPRAAGKLNLICQ